MGLFGKKIKFTSAICPQCKGNLKVDSNLEMAYCQYCGAQCIVENAPKRKEKKSALETVLGFVEKQQEARKQEKAEAERKEEERKAREREEKERKSRERGEKVKAHFQKSWWIYVVGFSIICLLGFLTR